MKTRYTHTQNSEISLIITFLLCRRSRSNHALEARVCIDAILFSFVFIDPCMAVGSLNVAFGFVSLLADERRCVCL